MVSTDRTVRLAAARAFDGAPASWSIQLYETPPESADVVVYGPDVRAGDGVRFDPERPRALVEAVGRRLARVRTRVIAVTGTGGGTGVTSVSIHLAAAYARDRPACLLDLDPGGRCALRVGIDAPETLTWADLDYSGESLRRCALPVPGGFRVLLAPPAPAPCDTGALLESARTEWERVVVDVPGGGFREPALDGADVGVLMMSPTPASAARAAGLLAQQPDLRWAVVVNRLGAGGETTHVELKEILERRIVLDLSCSPRLRDREDDGRLLTSPSRWWRDMKRLARALEAS